MKFNEKCFLIDSKIWHGSYSKNLNVSGAFKNLNESLSYNAALDAMNEVGDTAVYDYGDGDHVLTYKSNRCYNKGKFNEYMVKDILPDKDKTYPMKMAYNKNGYMGSPKMAKYLCTELQLVPEMADSKHSVCSIGKSEKDGKWYGWSHRAVCGFDKGDKIFDSKYVKEGADMDDMPFIERGEEVIKTDEDAKKAAKNFANYMS